jgi:hypothetical protein
MRIDAFFCVLAVPILAINNCQFMSRMSRCMGSVESIAKEIIFSHGSMGRNPHRIAMIIWLGGFD